MALPPRAGTSHKESKEKTKLSADEEEGPEKILKKLSQQFGILGYVVLNKTGIPVKQHGMDQQRAIQYGGLVSELAITAREFLTNETTQLPMRTDQTLVSPELQTIRLRTKKHEIVIVPEDGYTLVVIQDPNYVEPVVSKIVASEDGAESAAE